MIKNSKLDEQWKKDLKNSKLKPCILSLDVGGTKISYGVIPINSQGELLHEFIILDKKQTKRGLDNLINEIINIVKICLDEAEKHSFVLLPIITAGFPGRYIGEKGEIIAKGSAENLSAFKGEFDNINPSKLLKEHLPNWCDVIIKNDAIAQFSSGLHGMMQDEKIKKMFLNQKLAYIGPGTGLGGGFCEIDKDGYSHFYTDGHIYDVLIKDCNNKLARAEDILSGRAFMEVTNRSAKEVNSDPELIRLFHQEIVNMGIYLAELIECIYYGNIKKRDPENDWPKADITKVKGTKYYLIGGSLGTIGRMGEIIRQTAQDELEKKHLFDIKLFPIEEAQDAALFGAAKFVYSDYLCKTLNEFRK